MPRATRPLEEPRHEQSRRLSPTQEAGRRSRPPAPRPHRREADQADQEASRLPRRAGRRAVQAGALSLLSFHHPRALAIWIAGAAPERLPGFLAFAGGAQHPGLAAVWAHWFSVRLVRPV